jgi:predicted nucleic acid-binding protein
MSQSSLLRVVIDTNVVFEGLTKKGGAAGLIIDGWLTQLFDVYISNALALEYIDVLSRKLSNDRWLEVKPILGTLLNQAQFTYIYFSWRPTSPDAGDDLVVDCGMNANAIVITSNVRDFRICTTIIGVTGDDSPRIYR